MLKKQWLSSVPFGFVILLVVFAATRPTQAQDGGQNPTPIVIALTPGGGPTAVPGPPGDDSLSPDRFEPNNDASAAAAIGLQPSPA